MTEEKPKKPLDAASRLAELRSGRRGNENSPDDPPAVEAAEEPNAFTTLSADRQQKVMLELRFKTDDAEAFPYSFLVRARFNPSTGILLDFSVAEVRIAGRHLRPLFSGLVAQRVATVQERDDLYAAATAAGEATVVTRIVVTDRDVR